MSKQRSGIAGQIIGSFEDLGKDIARETVKAPVEIVGIALEGGSSQKAQSGNPPATAKPGAKENTPMDEIAKSKDERTRRSMARRGLEYLAAKPVQKEPSVREKIEQEEEQKKKMAEAQKIESRKQQLPKMSSRAKRGDLRGITKQKSGAETSRNIRGD